MKHSVVLDYARCMGCTTCIKSCPTEAIRVRSGKAAILGERCIDCGKCIRVCPHKAIKSLSDPLSELHKFRYNIALPEPALYGQFENLDDVGLLLEGLLKIGFQRVFEVARASELLSGLEDGSIPESGDRVLPRISSACPAVLRLIRVRFPKLIPHVNPTVLPMELAAMLARREAAADTGLRPEEIGVFAIVPCSAKATAAHEPEGLQKPVLDGAFSIRDVYLKLLGPMKEAGKAEKLSAVSASGLGWAFAGGESAARFDEHCIAVDGIENVIRMLGEIEDGRISEAAFIELSACVQGCVGGCLTVADPFIAKLHVTKLMKRMPELGDLPNPACGVADLMKTDRPLRYVPAFVLDSDRMLAIEKMERIESLRRGLPGLDCGSCGAPSCHAFAEDVVLGRADPEDCIFKVRERMQDMAGGGNADDYLPAPFRRSRRKAAPDGGQGQGRGDAQ